MDVEIFESAKKNLRIKNIGILEDGAETNSDSSSLTFCLFSIKRGIWTFSRRSRAGKCPKKKSLMHVQICCFANQIYCFLEVLVAVTVAVAVIGS